MATFFLMLNLIFLMYPDFFPLEFYSLVVLKRQSCVFNYDEYPELGHGILSTVLYVVTIFPMSYILDI